MGWHAPRTIREITPSSTAFGAALQMEMQDLRLNIRDLHRLVSDRGWKVSREFIGQIVRGFRPVPRERLWIISAALELSTARFIVLLRAAEKDWGMK